MFYNRRDGKLLKNITGVEKFLYHLKPRRSESEVHIYRDIDVSNLTKYFNDLKKRDNDITYFHLFVTSILKCLYNYPYLNRFIVNGSCYMRNDISVGFVAKTSFENDAKECLSVIRGKADDNLFDISKKIRGDVNRIRSNNDNKTDNSVEFLGKMPNFLRKFIIYIFKLFDKWDLLPKSLTCNSIYHASVLVTNLGSIGCTSIYHNLSDFGTNGVLISIGKIEKKQVVVDGKVVSRDICSFGITLDERIADGFRFIKAVDGLEYILNNPELLEESMNVKISNK